MFSLFALLPLAVSRAQEAKTESTAAATDAAKADEAKPDEPAAAAPAPLTVGDLKVMADTVWVMVTAMLVFFMNLGFACVESGMCRAKNCVNILSKNFVVFAVTTLGYWVVWMGLKRQRGCTRDFIQFAHTANAKVAILVIISLRIKRYAHVHAKPEEGVGV